MLGVARCPSATVTGDGYAELEQGNVGRPLLSR